MYRELIGAGILKFLGVIGRVKYHQVNIADLFGGFADKLDDHRAKTDIGHKTAIHNVKVKPIGLTFVHHFTLIFQPEEISSQ
jgi:hypothetical protein